MISLLSRREVKRIGRRAIAGADKYEYVRTKFLEFSLSSKLACICVHLASRVPFRVLMRDISRDTMILYS
jgi:hypothetical protein